MFQFFFTDKLLLVEEQNLRKSTDFFYLAQGLQEYFLFFETNFY